MNIQFDLVKYYSEYFKCYYSFSDFDNMTENSGDTIKVNGTGFSTIYVKFNVIKPNYIFKNPIDNTNTVWTLSTGSSFVYNAVSIDDSTLADYFTCSRISDTEIRYTIDVSAFGGYGNYSRGFSRLGVNGSAIENYLVESVTKTTVTQNLTNCTSNFSDTSITAGDTLNITLTANDGYVFDTENPPMLNDSGLSFPIAFSVSEDKKTATISYPTDSNVSTITIDATATEKKTVVYTVTQNLTNCTSDFVETSITENTSFTIKVSAKDGYIFNNVPTSNIGTVTLTEDKLSATITGTATDNITITAKADHKPVKLTINTTNCTSDISSTQLEYNSNFSITITANDKYHFSDKPVANVGTVTLNNDKTIAYIKGIATEDITITATAGKYHTLFTNLINCSCNYENGTIINDGETVTLEVTANDGFILDTTGTIKYYSYGVEVEQAIDSKYYSEDRTKLSFTETITSDFTISQSAKVTTNYSEFLNIYKTNEDELNAISKVRFVGFTASSSKDIDYGQFIVSVIEFPFAIDDSEIAKNETVYLGNYNSGVNADKLKNLTIDINVGEITIPEKYKNVYDYKNISAKLYLPFTDSVIDLPIQYVMNQTITVTFRVNLTDGKTLVIINSTFTNNVVYMNPVEIGYNLPFINNRLDNVVSKITSYIKNNVDCAFIELTRNKPFSKNGVYGYNSPEYVKISECNGFNSFSNIRLISKATNEEYNEIISLLNGGVII